MISCEQFDYIELVCLFHYPVHLLMVDGSTLQGKAMGTKRSAAGDECLEIEVHGVMQLVVLDRLKTMTVKVENPHFSEIEFEAKS